jgi:MFS family permease
MSEREKLINPLEATNNNSNLSNTEDLIITFDKTKNGFLVENPEKIIDIDLNKNINQSDSRKIIHNDLNKIMENSGYNLVTFKAIFFAFLFCFIEGFCMLFFSNIATAFQQYYQISNEMICFISAILFLGIGLGCTTVSLLLKIMTRRNIILMSVFFLLLSYTIIGLIRNLIVFIIFRFISSIFLGFYMVLTFGILAEYLPVRFRGFIMNFIWYNFKLGAIYFLLFCKVYIPNLNYDPSNKTIPQDFHTAIFSIVYVEFIALLLIFFFLKDSPRNLFINNKKEEAGEILEYYVKRKLTNEELDAIYNNLINSGENLKIAKKTDYKLLFSRRYLKFTIIMFAIFFLFCFNFYGINISLPIILEKIISSEKNSKEKKSPKEINSLINYYLIMMISALLTGVIAELKFIGKKYSEIILISTATIFSILSLIFKSHFQIFISISMMLNSGCFNLHISWTAEIIPTKIRDLGFGFFLGGSRVGAFISQFIFYEIAKVNTYSVIYIYTISLLVVSVLLMLLAKNEIGDLDSTLELANDTSDDEINKAK